MVFYLSICYFLAWHKWRTQSITSVLQKVSLGFNGWSHGCFLLCVRCKPGSLSLCNRWSCHWKTTQKKHQLIQVVSYQDHVNWSITVFALVLHIKSLMFNLSVCLGMSHLKSCNWSDLIEGRFLYIGKGKHFGPKLVWRHIFSIFHHNGAPWPST